VDRAERRVSDLRAPLDLATCDREPIHVPGAIQPHGVLIALAADGTVVAASDNLGDHCGVAASSVVGRPITGWLGASALAAIAGAGREPFALETPAGDRPAKSWDAVVHRSGDTTIIELEPPTPRAEASFRALFVRLEAVLAGLGERTALAGLCATAADAVRDLTGFDRVMVYQFAPDWHGVVVAEARADDIDPLLGLHFPASDIPAQARRLYTENRLRLIADAGYTPSRLVGDLQAPLDLSGSILRSVSPVHLAYLRNMNVAASMSVSILRGGQLWGLIALHHRTPRFVPQPLRKACEMIGQLLAQRIAIVAERDQADAAARRDAVQARILAQAAEAASTEAALQGGAVTMLDLVAAGGCAVCIDGRIAERGATPPGHVVADLVAWLDGHAGDAWATTTLPVDWPAALPFRDCATGLLAVRLEAGRPSFLLWFRPETIATIGWAGDPAKPAAVSADGRGLEPRRSFAVWRETVELRAVDWQPGEIEAARGLVRAYLVAELRRKGRDLEAANQALAASNAELDAFAHAVSHDLKEPLRGVGHHLRFLREDHGEALGAGAERLAAADGLLRRMRHLLDGVLELSRVGRTELAMVEVDLAAIAREVREMLAARLAGGAELRVPAPLPRVRGDAVLLRQLLVNLVGNGLTYNRSATPWVEITASAGPPATITVRDNGVGIPAGREQDVFRLFKRVHADAFGDGTGAGLALVQRIVARHGGRVWPEAAAGGGTVFRVVLGREGEPS
jgi:chemotaxis family two-component system sensor kinase Cph1